MVESPAINRENYLVFTAYTMDKDVYEKAPVVSGSDLPPVKRPADSVGDFSGCYANLKSRSKSVIMPAWCDFSITWNGTIDVQADREEFKYDIHDDPSYQLTDGEVVKLISPWMVNTSKPEVEWVSAKSLHNKRAMSIPSGITAWDESLMMWPIFVYVPRVFDYQLHVEMNHPLMSFYPISDLPIHVETYLDPQKCYDLYEKQLEAIHGRKFASFYLDRKHNEKKTCPQNVS